MTERFVQPSVFHANNAQKMDVGPAVRTDPPIEACPKCGSDVFEVRLTVSGTIVERHSFSGTPVDNTGMWDGAQTEQHKRVRCADCDAVIAKALS